MADRRYIYIRNYSSNGEVAISKHVFEQMAILAVRRIKGASTYKGKANKNGFSTYNPVTCNVTRDNKVDINIDVTLKKNIDIKATCLKIQDEVNSSFLFMCELIPVNVRVNVASIEG